MSQQIFGYIDDNVGTNINLPETAQFRAFRGNQPPGSGIYYAKLSDGTLEEIGGNGMGFVGGSGTLNFIAKFTPDGTTVGNSQLFDNGTSVGINTATPSASALLDITSTTQGFLAPRMTTVQRNAIVAPGTGLFIYNTTTSKFNYWDGAAWQSIDTHMGTGDVEGSGTTGQLPVWTDGPNSVIGDSGITAASVSSVIANAFVQGGNSFGANAVLGTNDVFSLAFETSGTTRMTISATGFIGVNTAPVANQLITATSTGTTSASYLFRGYNSTPTEIFSVDSNGHIYAGFSTDLAIGIESQTGVLGANDSTSLGYRSLRVNSGIQNTGIGSDSMRTNTSGQNNTAMGWKSLEINTTGNRNTAIGSQALRNTATGNNNTSMGFQSGLNIMGDFNTAYGSGALGGASNVTGTENVAVGASPLSSLTSGSFNTAIGDDAMNLLTTGSNNTAVGLQSGKNITTTSGNVFLGYRAGFFETGSSKLFIDNTGRTDEADGRAKSLVYGKFAATTAAQVFNLNANVGIGMGETAFGTNADFVLGIMNGTAPTTSPANMIQIFSVDTDDATASLGLRTEQAVVTEAVVSDRTLKVTINGTIYKICLKV